MSLIFYILYDFKSYKKQGFLSTFSFRHYDRIFVKVEKIIFYLIASFIIAFKYVNLWCVSLHLHSSLRPCKWWPWPQSAGFRKYIKLLKKFLKCDEILSVSIESIWLLLSCVSLVLELGQTFQLFWLTFSSCHIRCHLSQEGAGWRTSNGRRASSSSCNGSP